MRIGIDARLSGQGHAGIGRYTEELLRNLLMLSTSHKWFVFVRQKDQLLWLKEYASVQEIVAPISHYSVQEQLMLPFLFEKEKLDLLHVPHFNVPMFYRGKYVVTIHDLLWHERKDRDATTLSPLMHKLKYGAYRYVAEQAIKRASAVIVPSKAVADTVNKVVPGSRSPVVIYEGVADSYRRIPHEVKKQEIKLNFPFILNIGSLYPHKNVKVLLEVLNKIPEIHLVQVSSRNVFQEKFKLQVEKQGLSDRVHVLGNLSDEEVSALYQKASALVFPSFSEGFGLPGLEAMSSGCPVVASSIPVFHEIYGKAAVFIDPSSSASIKDALLSLKNASFRDSMILAGTKQASLFSWKNTAKQTLKVYETA